MSALAIAAANLCSGWTPAGLPNLIGWWRADKGVTIATGVSAWKDFSGNGNTLTQATGSNQPTLNATDASFGGQASFSYSAANLSALAFTLSASGLPQPFSAFIVGSFSGGGTIVSDNVAVGLYYPGGTTLSALAGTNVNTAASIASPCVIGGVFAGASSAFYVNSSGTPASTSNPGATGFTASDSFIVGSAASFGGNTNGKIAEVMLFKASVPVATVKDIFQYASRRYGFAAS